MTEPTLAHAGPPSAAQPLFILAMDHRDSFGRTLFGVKDDTPTDQQLADMRSAKSLIFEAAERVLGTDLGGGQLGILVDEQLGADVARRAQAAGFVLAMPVEVSGSDRFRFEYGDDFGEHIEEFDPDWIKVLVRFNPADAADLQQDQLARLRRLDDWAATHRRRWLLELLVPPTRQQLAAHEDQALFDARERPALTAQVITTMTKAAVRPQIWKLEGYETTEGAQLVLDAIKQSADPGTQCIVLGGNAPERQVDHWLDVAAPLEGYVGFAIGRSIWEEPLADFVAGRSDRDSTGTEISDRHRRLIHRYLEADRMPAEGAGLRSEPFTLIHPRLTPDREGVLRRAVGGTAP